MEQINTLPEIGVVEGEMNVVEDVVANVSERYSLQPDEAIQKTEELVRGVVDTYPEAANTPLVFLKDLLKQENFDFTSTNFKGPERVQAEWYQNKQQEYKNKALGTIEDSAMQRTKPLVSNQVKGETPTFKDYTKDTKIFNTQELKDNTYFGSDAVKMVEKREGALTPIEKRVVSLEGFVDGTYKDTKGIVTSGVGQTGIWRGKPFKSAVREHINRAKELVPNFQGLSEELKAELVQLVYRGDIKASNKWLKAFNKGNYKEAEKLFRNHREWQGYIKSGKGGNIPDRLEAAAKAIGKE